MATNTDTPRSRLTQDTPAGEPDHASRHIPIGSYTDDPAANARHSADHRRHDGRPIAAEALEVGRPPSRSATALNAPATRRSRRR